MAAAMPSVVEGRAKNEVYWSAAGTGAAKFIFAFGIGVGGRSRAVQQGCGVVDPKQCAV